MHETGAWFTYSLSIPTLALTLLVLTVAPVSNRQDATSNAYAPDRATPVELSETSVDEAAPSLLGAI